MDQQKSGDKIKKTFPHARCHYLPLPSDRRWAAVYGYILIILLATPYLPSLIWQVSARWSASSLSRLVLSVELLMAGLLVAVAAVVFFSNRRRFLPFVAATGGSFAAACFYYLGKPNPYELTHFPEYGLLALLIIFAARARKGLASGRANPGSEMRPGSEGGGHTFLGWDGLYLRAAALASTIGVLDELYQGLLPARYFDLHDILFNTLGAIMGAALVWAMEKRPEAEGNKQSSEIRG